MRNNCLTQEFEYGLTQLDMMVPDRPESSGLVFVDRSPLEVEPHEYIALEKARKYEADAVYFRRFGEARASIPQIYIYDFTKSEKDEDEVGELQLKLWNSGQVPLFFIFTRTEVKIFNCLKKPQLDEESEKVIPFPMETIHLAARVEEELEKLKEFSAKKFDNGTFWEVSRYKDNFNLSEGSYETLLVFLKKKRNELIKKNILKKSILNKLLVMSILVKYLEERRDEQGNTVFPEGFFSRYADGAKEFTEILKTKGACLKLFDYLSRHFNGEIFRWDDDKERAKLSQTDLTPFARFLEARTEISGQGTLWRLYSFNDLPIELISNIYEEFLGDRKGVVYTPPYLVHFLIDEAMPLATPKPNFKVLDPACGSGVFLVAAYQRIIHWWRIQNNWRTPDLNTLKRLLKENIYGVDVEEEAVRLATFSLSLALLDELSPKVIWEELKFDNLKNINLFEKDFFELIERQELGETFELIIGNPPFIEKFATRGALHIEEKQKKKRVPIPNSQLAFLFLEQSLTVCKSGGLLCMILPSGPFLYYNYSPVFRKYFLQTCNVKQILDFTPLAEILFGNAKIATLAVFAKKGGSSSNNILHVTFRRTKTSKEKLYFELDHYELHRVSYEDALNSPMVWKANLLGGGRLHHLISRLSNIRKLNDYLKEKIKKDGWVTAEGFIIGNKNEINRLKKYAAERNSLTPEELKELKWLEKKYKKADYLTGKKTLPTGAFTEDGIDEQRIHILKEELFLRIREENKQIFRGPHILIKEVAARNSIPIAFRDDDLSFKHPIIGIHSPENQREELLDIVKKIKGKRECLFCAAAFSGLYMINRATAILKKDIDNLPYPETESELELSEIEHILVDDVLEYMLDFRRGGENSKALKTVTGKQLKQFGEVYCKILNTVYDKFKAHEPILTESFVCFPLYYGEMPDLAFGDADEFENNLTQLVHKKVGRNLRIVRVIRMYDQNVIYLIKPNQTRYWLRSVAVRDADETFEDLIKQGY